MVAVVVFESLERVMLQNLLGDGGGGVGVPPGLGVGVGEGSALKQQLAGEQALVQPHEWGSSGSVNPHLLPSLELQTSSVSQAT